MPFFLSIIGLAGSICFYPQNILFPILLWLKVYQPTGLKRWLLLGIAGGVSGAAAEPAKTHACIAALWLCSCLCGCLTQAHLCGCLTQAHLPPYLLQMFVVCSVAAVAAMEGLISSWETFTFFA